MPEYALYEIRNLQTEKLYVGSTKSTRERFAQHRRQLRQGVHHNRHLQRAWNKQAGQGFKFVTVGRCSAEDRWDREEAHFERFPRSRLYNHSMQARGGTRTGQKNSPTHRARASASLRGLPAWNKGGTNTWKDKIAEAQTRNISYCIKAEHLDGRVRTYFSAPEAAEDLGLVRKYVDNILNGRARRTRSGWAFTRASKE